MIVTTNKNFPPGLRTLLKSETVVGMSGTQCRQEKEVTREKEEECEDVKEPPWEVSSLWKVMPGAWWCWPQWLIISSEMSTPTTCHTPYSEGSLCCHLSSSNLILLSISTHYSQKLSFCLLVTFLGSTKHVCFNMETTYLNAPLSVKILDF